MRGPAVGKARRRCRARKVDMLFSGFNGMSRSSTGQVKSLSPGCSGCRATRWAGYK